MGNVKIVLNRSGVKKLLKSDEMMQICKEHAYGAQSKLGEGYEVTSHVGVNRVNASVSAESYKAKKENLENNTILKALR